MMYGWKPRMCIPSTRSPREVGFSIPKRNCSSTESFIIFISFVKSSSAWYLLDVSGLLTSTEKKYNSWLFIFLPMKKSDILPFFKGLSILWNITKNRILKLILQQHKECIVKLTVRRQASHFHSSIEQFEKLARGSFRWMLPLNCRQEKHGNLLFAWLFLWSRGHIHFFFLHFLDFDSVAFAILFFLSIC